MEIKKQPKLLFKGVDFVNVNVTITNPPDKENFPNLDLTLTPKVFYPKDKPNEFSIVFEVKVTAKDIFEIFLVCFGYFVLDEPVRNETAKPFINTNAPAIMFPFIRSFVSTLTANLGNSFSPVILSPHFFAGEIEEYFHSEESEENENNSQDDDPIKAVRNTK
jgi:preprotein translocase subunit SecB